MNNPSKKSGNSALMGWFAAGAIIFAFAMGFVIYYTIMKVPANFEGGDVEKGHPKNILGIISRGGFIVPLLVAINIMVSTFFIERMITLASASGRGNATSFIRRVRDLLA